MIMGMFQQQDAPEPPSEQVTIRCMKREHFLALRGIETETGVKFKRAISDAWLSRLEPGILYPIIDTVPVNDAIHDFLVPVVRVRVMLNATAVVWADLPESIYEDLPEAGAASTIIAVLTNMEG